MISQRKLEQAFRSKKKNPPLTIEKLVQIRKFLHSDLFGPQDISKEMIEAMIQANGGYESMKRKLKNFK